MDEQAASTRVLGSAIVEWLTDEVLQDSEPAILYRELCQRERWQRNGRNELLYPSRLTASRISEGSFASTFAETPR